MKRTSVDVGVDLGTSVTKAVVLDDAARQVSVAGLPTQWMAPRPNWAQREPETLIRDVDQLLADVVSRAQAQLGLIQVRSIGFTGMAETGVLLDEAGCTAEPMIAWYDPRGTEEINQLSPSFREEFPAISGLPVSALATVFKLLWMRAQGVALAGRQWLSLPEFVCHRLGSDRVSERSLLGRTGLLDIATGIPAAAALELIGVDTDFVPRMVGAGTPIGTVRPDHLIESLRGATLTVAGHDHLVAAAAAGAAQVGSVFDSFGTAEALVGAATRPPSAEQIVRLVELGITVSPHVVRGTTCLLAGAKSGLVFKRVLRLVGVDGDLAGAEADALLGRWDTAASAVSIQGFGMSETGVTITLTGDGVTPAALWRAALDASAVTAERLLNGMRGNGVTVDELILGGGWSQLASVARSRSALADRVRIARMVQPGLVGAALMGRWAADQPAQGVPPDQQGSPPADWFKTWELE